AADEVPGAVGVEVEVVLAGRYARLRSPVAVGVERVVDRDALQREQEVVGRRRAAAVPADEVAAPEGHRAGVPGGDLVEGDVNENAVGDRGDLLARPASRHPLLLAEAQ